MDNGIKAVENSLKNISNKQIRKEIIEVNEKQITDIGYLSLFEILDMSYKLKNAYKENIETISSLGKEKESIINLFNRLDANMKSIDVFINNGMINHTLRADYFRNMRNTVLDIIKGISGYLTEISYAYEIASSIVMKDEYKIYRNYQLNNLILEEFYQKVYSYVTENQANFYERTSKIISILPVRISKDKFYDIVRNSLVRDLRHQSKDKVNIIIDRYRSIFNGALDGEYGSRFDYFFTKAQQARLFDFKSASFNRIKEFYNNTGEMSSEVYKIVNLIRQYGLVLNRYIIISSIKDYLIKNTKNHDVNLLIEKCKFSVFNDNYDEFSKMCTDFIIRVKKKISSSNEKLQQLINEYLNRGCKVDDELKQMTIRTQNILAYYNDYYLEDEKLLIIEDEDPVDINFLEQAVDNLIQFIDRNIKDMENIQRKVRMRRILSAIHTPFVSPEDFFEYVKNSMGIGTTIEEKLLCMKQLDNIMNLHK